MESSGSAIVESLHSVKNSFEIDGKAVSAHPCGNGHINKTYAVEYRNGHGPTWYILQRINHHVFKNPPAVMRNIELVTNHIRKLLEAENESDINRKVLTPIPTKNGASHIQDEEGYFWRSYLLIQGGQTHEVLAHREMASEVASTFARFQNQLSSISASSLETTIPNFHNTPWRFQNLVNAIEADKVNRASSVKKEVEFALKRNDITSLLIEAHQQGEIPLRVTHNDTKANNVILDNRTNKGLCVIDLDTVMPGLSLYDFGDMVRTAIATALEDEKDLSKVDCNLDLFDGLVEGYLDQIGSILIPAEKKYLAFSGKLITFEMGLRFLTDYLEGDVYYSIKHSEHNIDRARTQFKMVQRMEELEDAMEDVVVRNLQNMPIAANM